MIGYSIVLKKDVEKIEEASNKVISNSEKQGMYIEILEERNKKLLDACLQSYSWINAIYESDLKAKYPNLRSFNNLINILERAINVTSNN